ncbi:hypothetical protein PG987_003829 [Apiospora arundinis]
MRYIPSSQKDVALKSAIDDLRKLAKEASKQLQIETTKLEGSPREPQSHGLPPNLRDAVLDNYSRTIEHLRNENGKLKSTAAGSPDERTKAFVEERFRHYKTKISNLEGLLVEKDAHLSQKSEELEEQHDKSIKLQLQVQKHDEKIAEQSRELEEANSKSIQQARHIKELKDTVKRQADELEQANATVEQLVHEKESLQAKNEELKELFNEEVLSKLGETLASALSPKPTPNRKSDRQLDASSSDSPEQPVSMAEFRQVMDRLEKTERQCEMLKRKCSVLKDPGAE